MTDKPEPIRKSLLPCTPPSEWEFHSVFGAPHGCVLLPSDQGPVVVRRRVSYGDWEPVRPDRWAEEPPSDAALAGPAAVPSVPADADLRDRIAQALYERECPQGDPAWPDAYAADREVFEPMADAVLAALPAPADRGTTPFIPPAADGLPLAALDSATDGANALDTWARDPHGRNFLAHALVQLARDGWLRTEPGEGFEPARDRETPEPEDPDGLRRMADETQQAGEQR